MGGHTWSNNFDVPQGVKGRSDYWVVKLSPETSGSTERPTQPLSVYPNPARHSIQVETPDNEPWLNVAATDLLGRELLRQKIGQGGALDVSALPQGMYLLQASGGGGALYAGRFVVVK